MVLIVLIIVAGFVITQYISYRERSKLHLLIKAQNLDEVKIYETPETVSIHQPIHEDLHELVDDMDNPDDIRKLFKKSVIDAEGI